jgi:hypothetical protein
MKDVVRLGIAKEGFACLRCTVSTQKARQLFTFFNTAEDNRSCKLLPVCSLAVVPREAHQLVKSAINRVWP